MWIDDLVLSEYNNPMSLKIWQPDDLMLVLGNGNHAESECEIDACQKENIPILRRFGGGGAVLLHPGCVVVGLGLWVKDQFSNKKYFDLINQSLIDSLATDFPKCENMSLKGISDIAINEKKLVGTSIFRSRNYLLYQASILVDSNADLFSKYLKHPSKEPDYRKGKEHKKFVSGLAKEFSLDGEMALKCFEDRLDLQLKEKLKNELCDPYPSQFKALQKRLEKSKRDA